MSGKQVVPTEKHAAKIVAIRDASGDIDLFLIARTDTRSINSIKDAIEPPLSRTRESAAIPARIC